MLGTLLGLWLRFLSLLGSLLLRLRFLSLLGTLLLLWLLLWLLLLRLLGPLLLLRLRLRSLLFIVFFLRVCRDKCPKKQKQGNGVGNSNELHCDCLLQSRHWVCTQAASPPQLCSTAHAASASALILCTVASGRLGG